MQYVFFGSGPVAVESFKTLRTIFNFKYVVTKSTTAHFFKPLITDEELVLADKKSDVDVFTATNISGKNIGILIDFGVIISAQSIDAFSHGIVNSHFSLLPKLRGADPITYAILEGHSETGVSLMAVDPGMDTGDILAQSIIELPSDIYISELTDSLIDMSNNMLEQIIPEYINGSVTLVPQDSFSVEATYADKTTKADGKLSDHDTAKTIDRKVRAYAGWPGTRMTLGDIPVTIEKGIILDPYTESEKHMLSKAKLEDGAKVLVIHTPKGSYAITQLKPDGKKSMTAEGFLAGYSNKLPLV